MRINRTQIVVGVVGLGVAASILVGCTTGSNASSVSSASSSPAGSAARGMGAPPEKTMAGEPSAAESSAPASGAAPGGSGTVAAGARTPAQQVALAPVNRSVIKTASVSLEVDVPTTGKGAPADNAAIAAKVSGVALQVNALVGSQGFVQSSTVKGATAAIILRVPVNSYDTVVKQIGDMGTVTSSQEQAQDVTGQAADLDSRVKTMRDSVNSVRTLLAKATRISDIIAIESELESRQADLESLEQQFAALSGQVALATVTVTLQGVVTGVKPAVLIPPQPADSGFVGGLKGGWHALKTLLTSVAALLGAVLPFTPLLAVILIGALIWRRRYQHRQSPPVVAPVVSGGPGE